MGQNGKFLAIFKLIIRHYCINGAQMWHYHLSVMGIQRYAQICWKILFSWQEKWKKVAKLAKNGKNKAKMAFFEILKSNFSKYRIFPNITTLPHYVGHRGSTKTGNPRKSYRQHKAATKIKVFYGKVNMGPPINDFSFLWKLRELKFSHFSAEKLKIFLQGFIKWTIYTHKNLSNPKNNFVSWILWRH